MKANRKSLSLVPARRWPVKVVSILLLPHSPRLPHSSHSKRGPDRSQQSPRTSQKSQQLNRPQRPEGTSQEMPVITIEQGVRRRVACTAVIVSSPQQGTRVHACMRELKPKVRCYRHERHGRPADACACEHLPMPSSPACFADCRICSQDIPDNS